VIAVLLAAALACGASANQMELNECAGEARERANAQELATYRAAMQRYHNDVVLRESELRWLAARANACDFDTALVSGGSIEPMIESQCLASSAQARIRDIGLFTGRPNPAGATASAPAVAEHDRIYGLLENLVTPDQRTLLADAENAWIWYRDEACARATNNCAIALTLTRTQELKDSWLADKFW
jgi:uncharacterized protein YecT (DUF1311 family)